MLFPRNTSDANKEIKLYTFRSLAQRQENRMIFYPFFLTEFWIHIRVGKRIWDRILTPLKWQQNSDLHNMIKKI